jgi:hypothetical protein
MKRIAVPFALAAAISVPLAWFAGMMLTPLLWRLEPILHLELAGHSGPSDWVLYVIWAVMAAALFFLIRMLFRLEGEVERDPHR